MTPIPSQPQLLPAATSPAVDASPAGAFIPKLRVLDLFSGIGGFSLGLERTGGFETAAFCEIEPFPRKVLAKHWPGVPCYDDVRTLTGARLAADGITGIDVITGGFPCQDISLAGRQAGVGEGTRSGLFTEVIRLAGDIRPEIIILENVANLLSGPSERSGWWFGRVLGALASIGYDAIWDCLPAGNLGAPHERDRVWVVAYASGSGLEGLRSAFGDAKEIPDFGCNLASANAAQIQRLHGIQHGWIRPVANGMDQRPAWGGQQWPQAEPLLCRVDDGIPDRVGRTAACGNAVVPQIPELIGHAILNSRITGDRSPRVVGQSCAGAKPSGASVTSLLELPGASVPGLFPGHNSARGRIGDVERHAATTNQHDADAPIGPFVLAAPQTPGAAGATGHKPGELL